MVVVVLVSLFFAAVNGLKIWIPNTNVDNKLNWDKRDTPKNCDFIRFHPQLDVTVFWDSQDLIVAGVSLPRTGFIVFPESFKIKFRDREKCTKVRELNYIRNDVKGWLDPDNWKSDSSFQWLPHSERVPCAGEDIVFPSGRSFAVQLPSILVPVGEIAFEDETFTGEYWPEYIGSYSGNLLFKGPDDLRVFPWRDDLGCFNKKKCICGRSSYTIKDGVYRDIEPRVFEEAVCLYAMPKCQPVQCYYPVIPEGHCCGICGAVIKIQDETKDGLNISELYGKIIAIQEDLNYGKELKVYVGRTRDENVQFVTVAENPGDAIKSHVFAHMVKSRLLDEKFKGKLLLRMSGLKFSNYFFNSVSSVVFGTLVVVILFFASVFYIYLILPKKNKGLLGSYSFTFARFENSINEAGSEENLEIGVESVASTDLPQAFDNPMYSGNKEPRADYRMQEGAKQKEESHDSEGTSTKEYSNPVYTELEKSEEPNDYMEIDEKEKFSEIEL